MYLIRNKKEKARVLEIFKNAFANSPGITWMTCNCDRKLNQVLSLFIEEALLNQGAFITHDQNGAVLYFRIQNQKKSIVLLAKKFYLFLFVIGVKKSFQIMKYKKLIDSTRPKQGWLGWLVATDENAEGNVAAYEIKNEMFRIANETNEPIYVETTVQRVRALYRATGYQEYNCMPHPFKNLTIWFMKKEPLNPKNK